MIFYPLSVIKIRKIISSIEEKQYFYIVFSFTEEFVAHGANVNCLAMGHKTGRVMVTGGEDRKVNLWTAGKPNCIMVLQWNLSSAATQK